MPPSSGGGGGGFLWWPIVVAVGGAVCFAALGYVIYRSHKRRKSGSENDNDGALLPQDGKAMSSSKNPGATGTNKGDLEASKSSLSSPIISFSAPRIPSNRVLPSDGMGGGGGNLPLGGAMTTGIAVAAAAAAGAAAAWPIPETPAIKRSDDDETLFVGGLPLAFDGARLKQLFSRIAPVSEVLIQGETGTVTFTWVGWIACSPCRDFCPLLDGQFSVNGLPLPGDILVATVSGNRTSLIPSCGACLA